MDNRNAQRSNLSQLTSPNLVFSTQLAPIPGKPWHSAIAYASMPKSNWSHHMNTRNGN